MASSHGVSLEFVMVATLTQNKARMLAEGLATGNHVSFGTVACQ